MIVGTIIAALFSRMELRPLKEIMYASDKIADGDYSVRLNLRGLEEFQNLNWKFNHMAEEWIEYLDIIIDESERLAGLFTDVLNLSKVEQQSILTEQKSLISVSRSSL